MKILLTAINAKYIHSNLAIHSLAAYSHKYKDHIKLAEFTINHYLDDILQSIYKEKPDFIGLSCYIWNISMVEELCVELKKVLPNTKIWLGGPEVSYDGEKYLKTNLNIDGIMIGEGEETFKEILDYYIENALPLNEVRGIVYRNSALSYSEDCKDNSLNETLITTAFRPALNFSTIPFAYEDMADFENKIIYYETSRGCPYSCSYCLSSIENSVRLRDTNLVKRELGIFLDNKVPQVKFVDRTFNCNHKHAMEIWSFIKENDNGITNFHFEVSADILNDEELNLINSMREGLVQLEIGVQSTNKDTIKAIHRSMNMDKLKNAVNRIKEGENVHQHLDLIAGLPYEDLASFRQSFNDVYALKPDQLQLGFLKVLKGSRMHDESSNYGIVYKSTAPYEVLFTNWLSYDDVLKLKSLEDMVETYYNSGQFVYAIKYMEHFFETPFDLYQCLGDFYENNNLFKMNHNRMRRYEILIDFMKEQESLGKHINLLAFKSILVHDLYLRENLKNRPIFAEDQEEYKKRYRDFYYDEEKMLNLLNVSKDKTGENDSKGKYKQYLHLEHYNIDIKQTVDTGLVVDADQFMLYDYMHRNPLNYEARAILVEL
ncbi:MAG: hypothetical protein K0S41_1337 [Anaerocolumna sp.]|jgi:radical SAM superfamily enzyme YgiQ (UPF0313 family)|nr:hypothetical protein [Anaerocolumna sp.]